MRAQGAQMVMLIDEFGVIAGLLTVKQIVGEVVGKIVDADEDSEQEVETIDERTFQVDAGMRVDEANERLHLGLPDEEGYETLAGFRPRHLGAHPPRRRAGPRRRPSPDRQRDGRREDREDSGDEAPRWQSNASELATDARARCNTWRTWT